MLSEVEEIMSSMKKVLALCDEKTKDVVFGYVRRMQNTLSNEHDNEPFYIIAVHIIHIILSYYLAVEKFINKGNKYIKLSNNDLTASNDHTEWDTIYGSYEIDCGEEMNANKIFEWILMIEDSASHCVCIGIDETKRMWVNTYFDRKRDTFNYSLAGNGAMYNRDKFLKTTQGFRSQDTLRMELNLKDKTLTIYRVNSNAHDSPGEICKWDDIVTKEDEEWIKYCLAIYVWSDGRVTLSDFNIRDAK